MRYEFRIAIRYKIFVYCNISIYRYIVTPLQNIFVKLGIQCNMKNMFVKQKHSTCQNVFSTRTEAIWNITSKSSPCQPRGWSKSAFKKPKRTGSTHHSTPWNMLFKLGIQRGKICWSNSAFNMLEYLCQTRHST